MLIICIWGIWSRIFILTSFLRFVFLTKILSWERWSGIRKSQKPSQRATKLAPVWHQLLSVSNRSKYTPTWICFLSVGTHQHSTSLWFCPAVCFIDNGNLLVSGLRRVICLYLPVWAGPQKVIEAFLYPVCPGLDIIFSSSTSAFILYFGFHTHHHASHCIFCSNTVWCMLISLQIQISFW